MGRRYDRALKDRATEMAVAGHTYAEISLALKVPLSTVEKWGSAHAWHDRAGMREHARRLVVNAGLTLAQAAAVVGVSASTVEKWSAADRWCPLRHGRRLYSDGTFKRAEALIRSGYTAAEAAMVVGVSKSTIGKWSARYDWRSDLPADHRTLRQMILELGEGGMPPRRISETKSVPIDYVSSVLRWGGRRLR